MSEANQSYGNKDSERPVAKRPLKPAVPVVTRKEDEDYYDEQHYTRLRS